MYVCDRRPNLLHQQRSPKCPWQLPSTGYPRSKRPAVPHPGCTSHTHPPSVPPGLYQIASFSSSAPQKASPSLPCVFLLLPTTGQYTTVPTAHHAACQQHNRPANSPSTSSPTSLHPQLRTSTITLGLPFLIPPRLFALSHCLLDRHDRVNRIHGIDYTVSPARGGPRQLRLFLSARGKVSAPIKQDLTSEQ